MPKAPGGLGVYTTHSLGLPVFRRFRDLSPVPPFDEPIPVIRQGGAFKETAGADSSVRNSSASSLRSYQLIFLSLWCGLVAGPLEVGAIVLRKHAIDLSQFYEMSRHFVWLIPLTNLLIFLALSLAFGFLALCGRRGRWLPVRLLCALTVLPPLWAAFPRIYGVAGVILALGIAARMVPSLERHAAGFRRCVTISFPILAMITPLLAGSVWAGDWLKERSEAARRLPPSGSPNMLLIVLDTVAAGHLSLYGYDRRTSPTLDGLARRGARFDRVQATSSWTLPSHASFFTGRWPHELSANWFTPLDTSDPTLVEYLGSHGYATAGSVANTLYCGADTGLGRGFTVYRDYFFPELSAFRSRANRPGGAGIGGAVGAPAGLGVAGRAGLDLHPPGEDRPGGAIRPARGRHGTPQSRRRPGPPVGARAVAPKIG
jgi:hypothetical protein